MSEPQATADQLPPPEYDPTANGLRTYELACQLAREGDVRVRRWFESGELPE